LSGSEKPKTKENNTAQKGEKIRLTEETARLETDEARPLITTWPMRLGLPGWRPMVLYFNCIVNNEQNKTLIIFNFSYL